MDMNLSKLWETARDSEDYSLVGYSPWSWKKMDMTWWLNYNSDILL